MVNQDVATLSLFLGMIIISRVMVYAKKFLWGDR